MAKIFKSSIEVGDATDFTEMELFVNNYWGDELLEKTFPIPLWKLKQLFNAFPSSDVALKVTDITSITLVDAQWIAFDESLEDILEDEEIQANNYYFVLRESDFDELRNGGEDVDDRFLMIVGRIGKNEAAGQTKYYAFFNTAGLVLVEPGSAGQGASTGYKIPSP